MSIFKKIKKTVNKTKKKIQKDVKKTTQAAQKDVKKITQEAQKGVIKAVNTAAKVPVKIGKGIGGGIGAIGQGIGTGVAGISEGVSRGARDIAREVRDGVDQIGQGVVGVEHSLTGNLFGSSSNSYLGDNMLPLAIGIGSIAGGIYLKSQGNHLLGSSLLGGGVGVVTTDVAQYPISLIPIIGNLGIVQDLEDIGLWGGFLFGAAAGAGISVTANLITSGTLNPLQKNPIYDKLDYEGARRGIDTITGPNNPRKLMSKIGKPKMPNINFDPFQKNPLYDKVGDSGVTRTAKKVATSPTTGAILRDAGPVLATVAVPAATALLTAL